MPDRFFLNFSSIVGENCHLHVETIPHVLLTQEGMCVATCGEQVR